MQFQPVYPLPFVHAQPRPRFCVFRPGGLLAPLIPVDELPSWLQVCNWSPDMFMGLQPVSLSYIPREGEYDVICHHCSSSVDSLHQSISERNEESESPPSSASQPKSCPGAFFNSAPAGGGGSSVAKIPMGFPFPVLGQPPFSATLQSPLLGVYGANFPAMASQMPSPSSAPPKSPNIPRSSSSSSEGHLPELRGSLEQASAKIPDTPATSVHSISNSHSQKGFVESHSGDIVTDISGEIGEIEGNMTPSTDDLDIKIATSISTTSCSVEETSENGEAMAGLMRPSTDEVGINIAESIAKTLCSVDETSAASVISLTAAAERLRERMRPKFPTGQKSSDSYMQRGVKPIDPPPWLKSRNRSKSLTSSCSKGRKVPSPAHRRANFRRRRRADKTGPKRTLSNHSKVSKRSATKLEQPNSCTKRRDRRERLAQRLVHGGKDMDTKSRYWHMKMISNWRPTNSRP
ncbi:hypothetical protein N7478_002131 [Penicillium angulare]|uniref:uncharacterized protein n=1 Tax=Penicillium angulare TaxID=116970 RepID=UPI0025421344|nr:uncharacterized protein N7478_002131 [Penicillium angulare]KAJ5289101.1 hypothetical protein N7478_002131 [Penicillium angulare]